MSWLGGVDVPQAGTDSFIERDFVAVDGGSATAASLARRLTDIDAALALLGSQAPSALGGEALDRSYPFDLRLDPAALTTAPTVRRHAVLDHTAI